MTDELKRRVDLLKKLLDDPQPGLFTWNMAVADEWKAIAHLWNGDKAGIYQRSASYKTDWKII